jgi:hypothetical protein
MIYEQAKPADVFVDSVGVVTHMRYNDRPYWNYDLMKARLLELGVKNVRDEVAESWSKATVISRMQDLGRNGIKVTLLSSPWLGNTPTNTRDVALQLKDSLAAVEGPNEWNNNGVLYKGKAFPQGLGLYQNELHQAIKSTPGLYSMPVIAPSTFEASQATEMATVWFPCDYGNVHSYPGGQPPTEYRLDSTYANWAKSTCVSKPRMATETGYHYAVDNLSNPWHTPVNEVAGGRYVNRLLFDYFNRGIARTFIYELFDQGTGTMDPESKFGLLRNDGTPKPAFTAMGNTLTLLKETETTAFWPQYLAYDISAPTTVRKTILQKRNGRFYMVLWDDVKSYDAYAKKTIDTVWKNVSLSFASSFKTINIYRPMESKSPKFTYYNTNKLTVSVPDYPAVVELIP